MELTRKLGTDGEGGYSTMVNIASEACDIIGFPRGEEAKGTEVRVQIYQDRYVVRPIEGDDDE